MSEPQDIAELWAALTQPSAFTELAVLVLCVLLAWLLARLVADTFEGRAANSIMFGRRIVDGVLFPALLLLLAYAVRKLLAHYGVPLAVFKLAVPVFMSLLAIRLGVKVLQAAFEETPLVRLLERTISWVVWLLMVMWVTGVLPVVMVELDQINWSVGDSTLSVRKIIEGTLTGGLVLLLTLWISSSIEARLLRNVTGGELSLRKAVSNAARALLMFVGLLMALSAVGIDLTALSVLGGAIGVGVGFGLQKLAANYVSGFVILAERSMRIGDNVLVDGFEGRISEINARYTLIRSLGGRESIVPNEVLITTRVENLTLADSQLWQSTDVSVGYDSDVDLVTELLLRAARSQPRVLAEPQPAVALMAFGADGLEFRLGYWISDPENGFNNLRSSINLEILRLLREHCIEIPYPQRVVHQVKAAEVPGKQ